MNLFALGGGTEGADDSKFAAAQAFANQMVWGDWEEMLGPASCSCRPETVE